MIHELASVGMKQTVDVLASMQRAHEKKTRPEDRKEAVAKWQSEAEQQRTR